ncbi:MAG: SpoIIIAH-like family protein [Hungatella hathewayi]
MSVILHNGAVKREQTCQNKETLLNIINNTNIEEKKTAAIQNMIELTEIAEKEKCRRPFRWPKASPTRSALPGKVT